ncbi:MAG: TIGR02597 family protein [Phycisphaeraceae bacterium]
MKKASAFLAVALLGLTAHTATVKADTTGYMAVQVPVDTDVVMSVPFAVESAGQYLVDTKTGTGVTVSGSPLDAGKFNGKYYVRFITGAAKGRWTTITSNTTGELVFTDTTFLADVSAADTFGIYKHQTLSSLFPDENVGASFVASASALSQKTKILVLPGAATYGINKSAAETYYFLGGTSNKWRRVSPAGDADDVIMPPQTAFIVRNEGSVDSLQVVLTGLVEENPQARLLQIGTSQNDVPVATGKPYAVKLKDLGLGGSPAFVTSPSALAQRDLLIVYSNTDSGLNKSAKFTYYYTTTQGWRRVSPSGDGNNDTVPATGGFTIRKYQGVLSTVLWTEP